MANPTKAQQIETIKQHFADNARVEFHAGFLDGHEEIHIYVDGELVPVATLYPSVETTHDDVESFVWCINQALGLNRAALEATLRDLIANIPVQGLKALIGTAKQLGARQILSARYTLDAEGTDTDETWTLEQLTRSNPDTFCDEDIKSLVALPVGASLSFGGGAWGECIIKRAS